MPLAVCLTTRLLQAEDSPSGRNIEFRVFQDDQGEHRYAVSLPQGYSDDRRWPVLLFLHGASERGSDGELQLTVGLGPMLEQMGDFPFVVVFPQCEDLEGRYLAGWLAESPNGRRALAILNEVEQAYSVNSGHRVLCGWSMGGYGTWSIASARPDLWSAVLVLAGGGDPGGIGALAKASVPVWAIHGLNDSLIPPSRSADMVQTLRQAGGRGYLTQLANIDHDVWRPTFLNPAVQQWLLDPESVDLDSVDWEPSVQKANSNFRDPTPFYPYAVVRKGLGIRLGNDALRTISEGVPAAIPAESLRGEIGEIYRETGSGTDQISLRASGGRYECRVSGCSIRGISGGWLKVRFDLSPITLSFTGTAIRGESVAADTDGLQVVLGHRRPASLHLDLRPEVRNGRIRLIPLQQSFDLANDNWYVSRPENIRVSKGTYTPDNIATGIVGGLYLNRTAIVDQVQGVVPALLESVESRLNEIDGGRMVSQFLWPLPFLAPRLKLAPCELQTDATGVNVILDVQIARHGRREGPEVLDMAVTPISLLDLTEGTPAGARVSQHRQDISLLTSLDVIRALSQAVVDQTLVYINARDVPVELVARLGEPSLLKPLLPGLPSDPEQIRTNISLKKAFQVSVQETGSTGTRLRLSTSGVQLTVLSQKTSETWEPVAHLEFELQQSLLIQEQRLESGRQTIRVKWEDNLELVPVTAVLNGQPVLGPAAASSSVPSEAISKVHALTNLFREGWEAWVDSLQTQTTEIPDLEIGSARLRWQGLAWESVLAGRQQTADALRVSFDPPEATVSNQSSQALIYEIRGSSSQWTGPFFLPPQSEFRHRAGYPLQWREYGRFRDVHDIDVGATLTIAPSLRVTTTSPNP